MIDFFVECIPPRATHHSKQIQRIGKRLALLDSPQLDAAKAQLTALFINHRPKKPLEGALQLSIEIRFPFVASHTKAVRSAGEIWKTTRPDCSNLAKTIEDTLCRLKFFNDDSQVSVLVVSKKHSERPGIGIEIEMLEALNG